LQEKLSDLESIIKAQSSKSIVLLSDVVFKLLCEYAGSKFTRYKRRPRLPRLKGYYTRVGAYDSKVYS